MNAALSRTGKIIKLYYVFMGGLLTGLVCGIIIENAIFYWLIYGYLPFGIGR